MNMISNWMLFALLALVLYGVAAITQKLSTNHISAELSFLCFGAAFVVIGGVISSTLLTLLVLPTLYDLVGTMFERSKQHGPHMQPPGLPPRDGKTQTRTQQEPVPDPVVA